MPRIGHRADGVKDLVPYEDKLKVISHSMYWSEGVAGIQVFWFLILVFWFLFLFRGVWFLIRGLWFLIRGLFWFLIRRFWCLIRIFCVTDS